MKKLLLQLLKTHFIADKIVRSALKINSYSYNIASGFSRYLEKDTLHPKHRLIKYHEWFAQHLKPHWDVIDIGCGTGAVTYHLVDYCNSITGIDINSTKINRANTQFAHDKITFICGDALTFSFPRAFNAIILSNVLEHIENRVDFLQHLMSNQSVTPKPLLLLRVPMITRDWMPLYKKELGLEWRLDKTHTTEYTLPQLLEELHHANLCIKHYDIQYGEFYGVIETI